MGYFNVGCLSAMGSLCLGLACARVIHAMRTLPAVELMAHTNAGIALATLMSLTLFRERIRWFQRVLAVLVICGGLACMGIERTLLASTRS